MPNAEAQWLDGWDYCRNITVDSSKIGSDLIEFPIVLILTSSVINYTATQDQGQDIRVVDAPCNESGNVLPYEIEIWNESGTSVVWFMNETTQSGQNDIYSYYYGNSSANNTENITGVWNHSYVGVWHGKIDNGTLFDSSDYGNNGTLADLSYNRTTGIAGYYFHGGATIGSDAEFEGLSALTIEAYLRHNGTNPNRGRYILGQEENFVYEIHHTELNENRYDQYTGGWMGAIYSVDAMTANQWYGNYIRYNGSLVSMYWDEATLKASQADSGTTGTPSYEMGVGCKGGANCKINSSSGSHYVDLDEVRISDVDRGIDWINATQYAIENGLLTYGSEISVFGDLSPPTITMTSPENTSYSSLPIDINVTVNEAASWCGFNLDGGTNTTMSNSSTTVWYSQTNSSLVNGTTYHLNVFCNDTTGNDGINNTIYFTYYVSSGQPYLINYSVHNLTSQSEYIYSLSYDDFDNDGYLEYVWSPGQEGSDAIYLNMTKLGVDYGLWQNGTSANHYWLGWHQAIDFDNDGDRDTIFARTDGDSDTNFYIAQINSDRSISNIMTDDITNDGNSGNVKPIVSFDCDDDDTTDFIMTWCNSGEITLAYNCSYDNGCNSSTLANLDASGEGVIKFINSSGFTYIYIVHGWTAEGSTTINIRKLTLNGCSLESNIVEVTNTSNGMASFIDMENASGTDVDGDGNNEIGVEWLDDVNNKMYFYYYEVNESGNLTFDFDVYPTGEDTDHGQWNCYAGDHDLDGDIETFCVLKHTDQVTKVITRYDCPSGSCTRTVLYNGTDHTQASTDASPTIRLHNRQAYGILPIAPMLTDDQAITLNYTLPRWASQSDPWNIRVWANSTDDLYMNGWCFDTGTGNLMYYVDFYKNGTLQSGLSTSANTTNGTLINLTLGSGNTSGSDLWNTVWKCDDGYTNSSTHNSPNITILDETPPTLTISSPSNQSYSTSDIWFNITANENIDSCLVEYGDDNKTMSNTSMTAWYHNNASVDDGTHQAIFWCNDTSGNINSTSIYFTIDTTAPTITIASPTNTSYTEIVNVNVTTGESANACLFNFNGSTNYTMNNDSLTNWYSTNQTILINGTTYNLIIYCNDTLGNEAMNETIWFTFDNTSDSTPPAIAIYSPLNQSYATNTIHINASSNETVDTWIANWNGTNITITINTSQTIEDGFHHLLLYANDSSDNMGLNDTIWFTVDTTAPVISSVYAGSISSSSATIIWTTNEAANSSLSLSLSGTFSNSSSSVTSHSIVLSDLSPSTLYTYTVYSCDANNNCANDSGNTFTTLASSGGGGGGVFPPPGSVCGPYTITPEGDLRGSARTLNPIEPFYLNIDNGNTSQTFNVSLIGEIVEYCEITEYPDSETPVDSYETITVLCNGPIGSAEGQLLFTTDTGCEDARAIYIYESNIPIVHFANVTMYAFTGKSLEEATTNEAAYVVVIVAIILGIIGLIIYILMQVL